MCLWRLLITNILSGQTKPLCASVSSLQWWLFPASLRSGSAESVRRRLPHMHTHTHIQALCSLMSRTVTTFSKYNAHTECKNAHLYSANNLIASYQHAALAACLRNNPKNRSVRHRHQWAVRWATPARLHYVDGISPYHLKCTIMPNVFVFGPQDDVFLP